MLAGLVVLGGMFAAGHMRAQRGMWGPHAGMHCPFMRERPEGPRGEDRTTRRQDAAKRGEDARGEDAAQHSGHGDAGTNP